MNIDPGFTTCSSSKDHINSAQIVGFVCIEIGKKLGKEENDHYQSNPISFAEFLGYRIQFRSHDKDGYIFSRKKSRKMKHFWDISGIETLHLLSVPMLQQIKLKKKTCVIFIGNRHEVISG